MQENKNGIIRSRIDDIVARVNESSPRKNCSELIDRYVDYLSKWMQTHNVVSRKNTAEDIWENIYDSIVLVDSNSIVSKIFSDNEIDIVDAGAGGGFPGIPLSIIFGEKKIILVDSNRKKCSFLRSVKANLKIVNVDVVCGKIEGINNAKIIISKAAFSPPNIGILANTLLPEGYLLLWASVNTRENLITTLKKLRLSLLDEFAYKLPDHPGRSILLFHKTR